MPPASWPWLYSASTVQFMTLRACDADRTCKPETNRTGSRPYIPATGRYTVREGQVSPKPSQCPEPPPLAPRSPVPSPRRPRPGPCSDRGLSLAGHGFLQQASCEPMGQTAVYANPLPSSSSWNLRMAFPRTGRGTPYLTYSGPAPGSTRGGLDNSELLSAANMIILMSEPQSLRTCGMPGLSHLHFSSERRCLQPEDKELLTKVGPRT